MAYSEVEKPPVHFKVAEMGSGVLEAEPARVNVLGIPVDRLTMAQALGKIEDFISEGVPRLVVTADSSGIVQAQEDPELKAILLGADLVTPDSVGVLWAAKRAGLPIPERVSGVDLLDQLCALSAAKGYRVFLLGGQPGVADLAAAKLKERHPGCNIVGSRHGYFKPEEDEEVAREVAVSQPQMLFVAMGIPRQEKFIRKTQRIIKAQVGMGVGGSLDVFSGKVRRAPQWFQRHKLEWLWRLLLNPTRIKKARNLPRFAWMVLRQRT